MITFLSKLALAVSREAAHRHVMANYLGPFEVQALPEMASTSLVKIQFKGRGLRKFKSRLATNAIEAAKTIEAVSVYANLTWDPKPAKICVWLRGHADGRGRHISHVVRFGHSAKTYFPIPKVMQVALRLTEDVAVPDALVKDIVDQVEHARITWQEWQAD